jgi:hypothetical protein
MAIIMSNFFNTVAVYQNQNNINQQKTFKREIGRVYFTEQVPSLFRDKEK